MERMRLLAEEWRCVPGYPAHYQVSNLGNVRVLPYVDGRGFQRKLRAMRYKDAQIYLTIDGRSTWCAVAALVLRAFVGPPAPHQRLARHLDDNRANNRLTNLAWGTDQDNLNDSKRNGRSHASYGRLGKPHTEETKARIRAAKRGSTTRHRISPEQRVAMEAGYRKHLEARGYGKQ